MHLSRTLHTSTPLRSLEISSFVMWKLYVNEDKEINMTNIYKYNKYTNQWRKLYWSATVTFSATIQWCVYCLRCQAHNAFEAHIVAQHWFHNVFAAALWTTWEEAGGRLPLLDNLWSFCLSPPTNDTIMSPSLYLQDTRLLAAVTLIKQQLSF